MLCYPRTQCDVYVWCPRRQFDCWSEVPIQILWAHPQWTSSRESEHGVTYPLGSVEEVVRSCLVCQAWVVVLGCSPMRYPHSLHAVEWMGSLLCVASPLLGARVGVFRNPDCVHIAVRFIVCPIGISLYTFDDMATRCVCWVRLDVQLSLSRFRESSYPQIVGLCLCYLLL